MATEKRLIDANAYVDELKWLQEQVSSASAIEIQEYIDRTNIQPTVDAVEVVRCNDCCFSAQHDPYDPMECVKWKTKWGVVYTTPDGYCHKGERKYNG